MTAVGWEIRLRDWPPAPARLSSGTDRSAPGPLRSPRNVCVCRDGERLLFFSSNIINRRTNRVDDAKEIEINSIFGSINLRHIKQKYRS